MSDLHRTQKSICISICWVAVSVGPKFYYLSFALTTAHIMLYINVSSLLQKIHANGAVSDEMKLTDLADDDSNLCESIKADTIRTTRKPKFAVCERDEEIKIMKQQLDCIENIQCYIEMQKQCGDIAEEWQMLAQVLDRAFMILFFIFQFLATLIILVKTTEDHQLETAACRPMRRNSDNSVSRILKVTYYSEMFNVCMKV